MLRVAREGATGLLFTWTDAPGTWGEYQVLALPESTGAPTPAEFDGVAAVVVAVAMPGEEQTTDDDGVADPAERFVRYKLRTSSACLGRPGTTCDGFPAQLIPCP